MSEKELRFKYRVKSSSRADYSSAKCIKICLKHMYTSQNLSKSNLKFSVLINNAKKLSNVKSNDSILDKNAFNKRYCKCKCKLC